MKIKIISVILLATALTAVAKSDIRPQHYVPDGNSAVTTDGKSRFNRALYGAHSGFRMDCSDTPEFGIYLPRMRTLRTGWREGRGTGDAQ